MSWVSKYSEMALSVAWWRIDVSKWIHLSLSCAWNQTKERVQSILLNYPDYLLVDEWLTLTWAIEQSLRILSNIQSTCICFDYKWNKKKIYLDLTKINIDPLRQSFVVKWNIELDELDGFIVDNIWDIHLPNWILRVEIERNPRGWFLFKAKKFFSSCDRAKRANLRAELNSSDDARWYFKSLNWTKVMIENDFSITTINWTRIWIVKDISQKWLCIFLPKTKATNVIENWKQFSIILPFLWMTVKFKVVKINRENKDFLELWWVISYSDKKQEEMVAKFIFEREREIIEEFKALKDWYEWIEKPVIPVSK